MFSDIGDEMHYNRYNLQSDQVGVHWVEPGKTCPANQGREKPEKAWIADEGDTGVFL